MTTPTPSGLPQPQTVAALREAATWLHAAYDRPPVTPDCAAMLERVDAALSAPAVETVAVQEARKKLIDIAARVRMGDAQDRNLLAQRIEEAARLLSPLPVAPKAEPKPCIYVDQRGALHSSVSKEQVEAILGPHIDHIRLHLATPQAASAQPVVADTLRAGIDALMHQWEIDWGWSDSQFAELRKVVADADRAALASPLPVAPKVEPTIINGEPATAHSMLAALIDIYDDAQNNAPEHRCYVESAWPDVLKEARDFLASAPQAEHQIIAEFLERTGQYVTNDATRDAAIAGATEAMRSLLEDWVNSFADSIEGGEADELVAATRAALSAPAVETVAVQEAPKLYVECRECSNCGHVGINDDDGKTAACNTCDWNGPSPKEDRCPGCDSEGTMTSACPKCGARSHLLAEAHLAAPLPVAPKAEPEWIDDPHDIEQGMMRNPKWKPAPQPVVADTLTDARIEELWVEHGLDECDPVGFARIIEREALASPPRAIPAEQAAPTEPVACDPLDALRFGANVAETLLKIGRAIGFGRAQQILGEQWEAEHDCAPRGRMGVTVKDAAHPHEAADRSAERLAFLCNPGKDRFIQEEEGVWRVYQDEAPPQAPMHLWQAMTTRWYVSPEAAIDAAMGTPAAAEPGKGEE